MATNLSETASGELPCPFCSPEGIVERNALAHVRYDRTPVTPGHALILPNRHFSEYFDVTDEEFSAMHALVRVMKAAAFTWLYAPLVWFGGSARPCWGR